MTYNVSSGTLNPTISYSTLYYVYGEMQQLNKKRVCAVRITSLLFLR